MSEIWLPEGARPPRATLPEGDITLADGIILVRSAKGTAAMQAAYRAGGQSSEGIACYEARTGMAVIASLDATRRWGPLLHLSISFRDRNPSWKEIRQVKQAFYGRDRDAMMVLPRERDYINVHDHCFHLWETPESWGMQ